ncbi:sensor domain-containing phosphodiesterase [Pseudoalteromonas sp. 10-33]|uniref:sensor domain-containing phosphodiesterase n=1 Tax=Pseudoalteromonas sp. 10-33 TaxID=1761890 RepID=UPI0007320086|nr:EAL domain-containing protein [Pseudoalteromonas sp. 10-33]KTF10136.1 diguanylate phosphodiesterase [Pseudoalteromonas sp. 10-33]
MEAVRLNKLLSHQQDILSKIALGLPFEDVLDEICLSIEELIDENSAKCSILSLNKGQLLHCAAPNIDDGYCQAINGVHIGPNVGSCGTAAYSGERVIVEDIAKSPLWADFKEVALQFGLRSCWSTPVVSTKSSILGTFAIYHDKPKKPSSSELELIDYFVHFTSIALEKNQEYIKANQLINDLEKSNEKFEAFTKVMPDLTLIISEEGEYIDIYGTTDALLYKSQSDLVNKKINDVLPAEDAASIMAVIDKTLLTNDVQVFEYELDIDGKIMVFEGRTSPIKDYQSDNPSQRYIVWVARDITTRKKAEKEVERLAFYDPLTGLPNRRMLNDKLAVYVENIHQSNVTGALLFLDLDNFKRINDSVGHSAGDEVLVELSKRFNGVIGEQDTLARVGGDEFIILLEYVGHNTESAILESEKKAKIIQSVFYDKFEVGRLAFQVSCSIGICLIDKNNHLTDNILKFADTAMYRSKMKNGNSCSFYDPELQALLENQAELETDIVRAIAHDEFSAYFQPQINANGKITGAEALIRWQHPSKGLIAPNDFIPIAEQNGVIQKLQNTVLRDICILINELNSKQLIDDSFKVSINISQVQFNSTTLKTELLNVVNDYGVNPSNIKLEITESMLSGDIASVISQIDELKQQGFIFSIDDFGTGYSCLTHLSSFSVNELKVDKSFIDKILDKGTGFSIVQTIINLGKSLSLTVVAEGVETEEQFTILKTMNVDMIQGYLIAKPMHFEDYLHWHQSF